MFISLDWNGHLSFYDPTVFSSNLNRLQKWEKENLNRIKSPRGNKGMYINWALVTLYKTKGL